MRKKNLSIVNFLIQKGSQGEAKSQSMPKWLAYVDLLRLRK